MQWLDSESPVSAEVARLLRVLKDQRGSRRGRRSRPWRHGLEPTEGASHTWEDVQKELCDVILTSMVALATLTPDARKVFAERLSHIAERSLS